MTDTQIAALREIVGRMTPGEWRPERRLRESVVLQSGGKQDGYANRVVCLPQWTPAPYPQPSPDDAFANATGIVALRNTALPIIDALVAERDAKDARIAELEGALQVAETLANAIQQTRGNRWEIVTEDPETMACDARHAITAALEGSQS